MQQILIAGAGKVGQLIAAMLASTGDYQITVTDVSFAQIKWDIESVARSRIECVTLDVNDKAALSELIRTKKIGTVISCLPYFCNLNFAKCAKEQGVHYFDLSEDREISHQIRLLGQDAKQVFANQCGLAPGFVSIMANHLIQRFDTVDSVLMRVGALPQFPNNALKYSLTWSTEGLINEYGNPCFGLVNGQKTELQPLEGLEQIDIDGGRYEAFYTSGGIGSLVKSYEGKIKQMNYKTLRYPGHAQHMSLLMKTLKLNEDRETFKKILEKSIPGTRHDVVIAYVAVSGYQDGKLMEETYVKKFYPEMIAGKEWLAIQVTAAAGLCAVVDLVLQSPGKYQGVLKQEDISLRHFFNNRFGQYYLTEEEK